MIMKRLALLAVAVCVTVLFSACGGNQPQKKTDQGTTSTTQTQETTGTATPQQGTGTGTNTGTGTDGSTGTSRY
jgi:ABC-type enterochelin transport system substrate-binding protein